MYYPPFAYRATPSANAPHPTTTHLDHVESCEEEKNNITELRQPDSSSEESESSAINTEGKI